MAPRKRKMQGEVVPVSRTAVVRSSDRVEPPAIVPETGKAAAFAYAEFFGAEIESPHTYRAYRHAVDRCLAWCAARGIAYRTSVRHCSASICASSRDQSRLSNYT